MLADAFNKKTGANLIVQPQAGDIRQKVITVIAAGTPPDVICLMGKLLLPLVSGQALINVSDLFKVWKINPEQDFAGDSIGAYTYDHTVWGVPVEVNMVGSSVAVPLDEVQKASLNSSTPPTNGKDFFDSYDQLWNVARRTQLVQNGQVTRWGLTSEGWELHSLCGIIRSQGVNWWDEAARKFNVYSDAGITAFKLLVETPVRMKIETELKMLSVDAVVKGKVALARGNASIPYAALTATGLGGKGSKRGPYELAMVPPVKGPLSGTNPLFVGEGGWGFIAAKSTPHRDLSVEFLHFIASPDGEGIWAGIYGGSPSAWRALNTPDNPRWGNTSDPVIRGLIRYSKYLDRTIYFGEGFGDETPIEGKAQALAVDIRQGKLTAELAAQQLQQFCETQYQKYLASLKK
ncbi:MAG: extracellular solute-binding protein [Chloroflexi bacterium]|nr:extracellular solute-binding protein [Chloroflexota bacterium]